MRKLLDAQDGRGAICGTRASKTTSRGKPLQVDHWHASNMSRDAETQPTASNTKNIKTHMQTLDLAATLWVCTGGGTPG